MNIMTFLSRIYRTDLETHLDECYYSTTQKECSECNVNMDS